MVFAGLGGALRRKEKPRGGPRTSRNDARVADLERQLQEVTVKLSQSEQAKEQIFRRVGDLETTIQSFLAAQANIDVPAPAAPGPTTDKSSCNSKQTPDDMHD